MFLDMVNRIKTSEALKLRKFEYIYGKSSKGKTFNLHFKNLYNDAKTSEVSKTSEV